MAGLGDLKTKWKKKIIIYKAGSGLLWVENSKTLVLLSWGTNILIICESDYVRDAGKQIKGHH